MADEEVLYLSQEGVDRQKALLELDDGELLDQLADVVMQICIRQRMRPRDLFEMILNAREDYLEAVIPVMAEALRRA